MICPPGYTLQRRVCENVLSSIYRAVRFDGVSVLLETPSEARLIPDALSRFRHACEVMETLDLEGVPKPLNIEQHDGQPILVLKDFGAETSLSALRTSRRLSLEQRLVIGGKLAKLLEDIHAHGIVHLGITPYNALCSEDGEELFLVGFDNAAFIRPQLTPRRFSTQVEEMLAYMSPEQTGRMNRSVDYRSDFYGLGATLYELLTDRRPLVAPNLIELMHALIAQEPAPIHEIVSGTSPRLSEVVLKMLKKTPEERYQSTSGILHDLQRCLEMERGEISDFTVGLADMPERFCISEKLYGRTNELDILLDAFERVRSGSAELLTVSGYSGIGKSALVREIGRPVTQARGLFVSGKFEQFRRNVPYSALIAALDQLLRQILSLSAVELEDWRGRLSSALGNSGSVVAEVIPSLTHLLGPQPPVPSLPPHETQKRFNRVFSHFFHALCRGRQPLVVFLDDLQWADTATLGLMEMLLTDEDIEQLLLIGAFRDNEVGPEHPLLEVLESLTRKDVAFTSVGLNALTSAHIAEMISDTLSQDIASVHELSVLTTEKTQGNPFFVKQFLSKLYDDGALRFEDGRWIWDSNLIREMGITDNVVDLLLSRMKGLPETARQLMRLAACIGSTFDLRTLSTIYQHPPDRTRTHLIPTLKEGLVLETEKSWRLSEPDVTYRFLHDRVQQAAHELINEAERERVHLEIARLLLADFTEEEEEERLFELVDHLNQGFALVEAPEENRKIFSLNLRAAVKAKDASAYEAALLYADTAATVIEAELWRDRGQGSAVRREQAELCYLNGDFERSRALIEEIWQNADNNQVRAEVQALLITQWTMLGDNRRAVEASVRALELFGMRYPDADELPSTLDSELHQVEHNLRGRPVNALLDNPPMTDPDKLALMKVLMSVHTPIFFLGQYDLYSWVLARMTNMSMRFGHAAESSKGYASFGNTYANNCGEYKKGYDFALLGIELARRANHKSLLCKNCLIMSMFLSHWTRPFRDSEGFDKEGIEAGFESGELQFIGYIMCYGKTLNRLHRGDLLAELAPKLKGYEQFCEKVSHNLSRDTIRGVRRLIAFLMTGDDEPDFENESEETFLETCLDNSTFAAVATYFTIKAYVLYLSALFSEAEEALREAEPYLIRIHGIATTVEYNLVESLVLAAMFPTERDDTKRQRMLERIAVNQDWMRRLVEQCPENFEHKYLLVEAERCRLRTLTGFQWEVDGPDEPYRDEVAYAERAGRLYDEAARSAGKNGFLQHQALAVHLAAQFYLSGDRRTVATAYLRDARDIYRKWGAHRLASRIDRHPLLVDAEAEQPFDFQTVMKASRTVSREIVIDRLLDRLMRLSIENSGAVRGVLILETGEERDRIVVEGASKSGRLSVNPVSGALLQDVVPETIVNYVANTRNSVVLDDARSIGDFQEDPDVQVRTLRSVLCLPLLNKGKLVGVLYLENNLTGGAFTNERLQVTELLASQAAIAIDNARLYSKLEKNVEMLRTSNEKLRDEISERKKVEKDKSNLEKQLMQTQKMEAIGRLAGGVAHDLNNLLTPIIGYSELLMDDDAMDASCVKKIELVFQAGMRARDLVHQLLAFARKQSLAFEPLNINKVLKDFERLIRRTIRENIEVEILLSDVVRPIMADVGQLEQVIMNLAVNAADAMPDGGKLTIETTCEELGEDDVSISSEVSPGTYTCLIVSDTGYGMDEETLQQIFDPFFTTKGDRGNGLGLATVYGIVKQHRGNIRVHSEQGVGTRFKICLPTYHAVSSGAKPVASIVPKVSGAETILLVEDNKHVRSIVREILEKHGHNVLIAEDGIGALEILETQGDAVQLLLTDVVMPNMNGMELYTRATEMCPGLNVLYMSGYPNDTVDYHGAPAEGVQLISKPFTAKALISKIHEVMTL